MDTRLRKPVLEGLGALVRSFRPSFLVKIEKLPTKS
jgi:hypothetical protein